jgi:hypothetical protein
MKVRALDIRIPKEVRLDLSRSFGSGHVSQDHPYRGFRHRGSEKEVVQLHKL